jgi:predicted amidohydrolase YtcJ
MTTCLLRFLFTKSSLYNNNLYRYILMDRKDFAPPADTILFNARSLTSGSDIVDNCFVAIKGDKILFLGHQNEMEQFRGAKTKGINCFNGTILPGFNDAHCHPIAYATTLLYVNCSPDKVKNIFEIQTCIKAKAAQTPVGTWVRAANYDDSELAEKRPPRRDELDQAAPGHPVILVHRTGQHSVLNTLAMHELGIDQHSQDGQMLKNFQTDISDGLISGSEKKIIEKIPPLDENELIDGLKLANKTYLSLGITSVQDTGWSNGLGHWERLKNLIENKVLDFRYCMFIGSSYIEKFQKLGLRTGCGKHHLRLGGVKIALDESTGCMHPPEKDIIQIAEKAFKAGFQLAFHVSDIYMLKTSLAAIESLMDKGSNADLRCRLEHCGICPPDLVPRLQHSQAIVVCQPSFLYNLGHRYIEGLSPEQLKWVFPFGSYRQKNIKMAFSSDAPFMPPDPLTGICAAMNRQVSDGRLLSSHERISLQEAIQMYTFWGAYASFEEHIKGSLTPGKLADLIVLNDDIFKTPVEDIKHLKVQRTLIGGKTVWQTD